MTLSSNTSNSSTATTSSLWQKGILAILTAVVVNLVIYFIGVLAGVEFLITDPTGAPAPILWMVVAMFTTVLMLLGLLAYWLLSRMTAQASRIFTILLVIVILLSFIPTFLAAQSTAAMLMLSLMHIPPGLAFYWFVLRN